MASRRALCPEGSSSLINNKKGWRTGSEQEIASSKEAGISGRVAARFETAFNNFRSFSRACNYPPSRSNVSPPRIRWNVSSVNPWNLHRLCVWPPSSNDRLMNERRTKPRQRTMPRGLHTGCNPRIGFPRITIVVWFESKTASLWTQFLISSFAFFMIYIFGVEERRYTKVYELIKKYTKSFSSLMIDIELII